MLPGKSQRFPALKLMTAGLLLMVFWSFLPWQTQDGCPVISGGSAFAQDEQNENSPDPGDAPPCPECPDPAKVVLNGLEAKKQEIAKAREALKQEQKALEKYKEELDEQLERLTKLKEQIDMDFARLEKKKSDIELQKEAEFEAKMDRLVKTYSGMKPKNAGEIIDKMDLEVARQIFARMREASAAQILAFVSTEKAAKISESIVYKKD